VDECHDSGDRTSGQNLVETVKGYAGQKTGARRETVAINAGWVRNSAMSAARDLPRRTEAEDHMRPERAAENGS